MPGTPVAAPRARSLPKPVLFLLAVVLFGAIAQVIHQRIAVAPTPPPCTTSTLAARVAVADLIVTGSVFAVVPGEPYARVLITPERVYRGAVPDRGITVLAVPADDPERGMGSGDPGTNELHFTSADPPYLLFLRERSDGAFETDRCAGTRPLGSGLTEEESPLLGGGKPTTP